MGSEDGFIDLPYHATSTLSIAKMSNIRDRVLILRVLVPGLEARLRDKMKEVEETAPKPAAHGGSDSSDKGTLLDLDGVHCEPTADGSDLWNFHCDGGKYPAR